MWIINLINEAFSSSRKLSSFSKSVEFQSNESGSCCLFLLLYSEPVEQLLAAAAAAAAAAEAAEAAEAAAAAAAAAVAAAAAEAALFAVTD